MKNASDYIYYLVHYSKQLEKQTRAYIQRVYIQTNIHTSEGGPLQMLLTLTPAVMSQKFGC